MAAYPVLMYDAAVMAVPSYLKMLRALPIESRLYCSLAIRIVWEDAPSVPDNRIEKKWDESRHYWLPMSGWKRQAFSYVYRAFTEAGLPAINQMPDDLNIGWEFDSIVKRGYFGRRDVD